MPVIWDKELIIIMTSRFLSYEIIFIINGITRQMAPINTLSILQ